MRGLLLTVILVFSAGFCSGQVYNRDKVCGTDTITIDYRDLKYGGRINYKAFECTQASNIGLRVNTGFSTFNYRGGTQQWMGNHNAGILGLAFVYGKFNLGVDFKLTTVRPRSRLAFNNDTLTQEAKLNPIKEDFYAGYSLDFKNNFSIEPHLGLTRNAFFVINEEELHQAFDISNIYGLCSGITVNKYFKLEGFQFICVFLNYNYGFSNYKKINTALGKGYSELSVGVSYKVFAKKNFHQKLN